MERIALFYNGGALYWSSVILTLSVLAAICGFISLYLYRSETPFAIIPTVPMALGLSLLLSRMVHWYCFSESYPDFLTAITSFSGGGFALIGAFAGCLLTALLTRFVGLHRSIGEMLDCMCLAGGGAIAVGRLSCLFNSADRGQLLEGIQAMPWAYPTINSISGATEYRLATFLLQAMVTALIVAALAVFFFRAADACKDGDTALLFLLFYCAAQILLDSTRYDSIYFRSNGFVSIVQVASAVALVTVIVIFSVRMVKGTGKTIQHLPMWLVMLAAIAGAAWMEYHVQRHSDQALLAYTIMGLCLLVIIGLTLRTYRRSLPPSNT